MTFFPDSGFGRFTDEEWNKTLGTWLQLPREKRLGFFDRFVDFD